jgi:glucokinase
MAAVATLAVLDIGGTHVTAARVDPHTWTLTGTPSRADLDAHADAATILDSLAVAGAAVASGDETIWAIAMPDPFDYVAGIGRFHGVAKFEALDGVDVRRELACRLPGAAELVFCNDADAFTVGEWLAGAAKGSARVVGLTLGTGVGSGWVDGGRVIDPGIPPGGRAHLLHVDGAPLEDLMSRRAIRREYADVTGDRVADVRDIAERAREGDPHAAAVLAHALHALGRALAVPLRDFGADVIVVGGSMSRSWDLFDQWFREGAGDIAVPPVRIAEDADAAPLLGAGYVALRRPR